MEEFYTGKNIFLTGATGFLAKVILEKLLREVPTVGKIYLLIRNKKGEKPLERIQKQIVDSRIFDLLRSQKKDFNSWVLSKLVVIEGDLTDQKLGISAEDIQLLSDNVHIVIHCAATLDFDEPFDQAIQYNVIASIELLEMAKKFKNMMVFTHISTAYVSCNLDGRIKERANLLKDGNVDRTLANYRRMTPTELRRVAPAVLRHNGFPNTYTYTKCLAELLLVKHREHVSLVIMRPTMIGASWKEPVNGWTDSGTAAAALYLAAGVGFTKFFPANKDMVGDQVPVDIVSNATLVNTYLNSKNELVTYCHVGSSSRNPITWDQVRETVVPYWKKFPPQKAISKVEFHFVSNKIIYFIEHLFLFKLPIEAYSLFAKYLSRDQKIQQNAALMKKIAAKQAKSVKQLTRFTTTEWTFEDNVVQTCMASLSKDDRVRFNCDITMVDWDVYFRNFCWGLATFVLKESDRPHPDTIDNVDWESLKKVERNPQGPAWFPVNLFSKL